jgi:hypothetical protein
MEPALFFGDGEMLFRCQRFEGVESYIAQPNGGLLSGGIERSNPRALKASGEL